MRTITPQSGILPPANAHALFISLCLKPDTNLHLLRHALAKFPELSDTVATLDPAAKLSSVVAIGSEDWDALYPHARPALLTAFPHFPGSIIPLPHTPVTALIHIRSERHDLNFELAKRFAETVSGQVNWRDDIHGFRYLDSRDLTGFVDGTENPHDEERQAVALVDDDADFNGGSYLHTQRYIHSMNLWQHTPQAEQEQTIGRTKQDDVEMDDEQKPDTAHISRVVIEENEHELEILRHSMPYGSISEMGLYFAAYAKTPANFTRMLERMVCRDEHGHYDHLLNFTHPVSGAAFFAPSRTWLEQSA